MRIVKGFLGSKVANRGVGQPINPKYLFLTTQEVAERYRVSIGTVGRWRRQGNGPDSCRVGGRRLYPIHALAKFENIEGF